MFFLGLCVGFKIMDYVYLSVYIIFLFHCADCIFFYILGIKWKTKNTTLSEHFQNPIERDNIDTPTQIHDKSLSWLGSHASMKSRGVKLVLWAHDFPLNDLIRSCKCFPHVSKMLTSHITGRTALLLTVTYNRADSVITNRHV